MDRDIFQYNNRLHFIRKVLLCATHVLRYYQLSFCITQNLGEAIMVDVGWKAVTRRLARAVAIIDIGPTAYQLVTKNEVSHCKTR